MRAMQAMCLAGGGFVQTIAEIANGRDAKGSHYRTRLFRPINALQSFSLALARLVLRRGNATIA